MKLKVLECPLWVKFEFDEEHCSGVLRKEFDNIEPLFYRDGYYLLRNKYVLIEYQGTAWICKEDKYPARAFRWELEDAEYDDINLLSKEQSDAIFTLMKHDLASEKQENLFFRDRRYRSSKKFKFDLKNQLRKSK
jgi:hypothetical protein